MTRFYMRLSLDHPGMWRVSDAQGVYGDSRVMECGDAIETIKWLIEADADGRLRTLESEFTRGEWQAE